MLKEEQEQDTSLPKLVFNGEKHFFSDFSGTAVCGSRRRIYRLLGCDRATMVVSKKQNVSFGSITNSFRIRAEHAMHRVI